MKINHQKIALVETFINFYKSKDKALDEFLKSDILWFATGLTNVEFEACKEVAKDYVQKEFLAND